MLRKNIVKDLAYGPHGQADELANLLNRFLDPPTNLGEKGILIEELKGYLAEKISNPSIDEARTFGMEVAHSQGKNTVSWMVTAVIRSYQTKMKELKASKSGKNGNGGGADDDDEANERYLKPSKNLRNQDDPR